MQPIKKLSCSDSLLLLRILLPWGSARQYKWAQSTNMFAAWIYQHLMFLDDVVAVHPCSHYSSVPGNKTKTRMHNKEKYYDPAEALQSTSSTLYRQTAQQGSSGSSTTCWSLFIQILHNNFLRNLSRLFRPSPELAEKKQ